MHKAGSTVMNSYLERLLVSNDYKYQNVAQDAFESPFEEGEYCIGRLRKLENQTYYGCFRGPYAEQIPTLKELKILAQVRNPLDCIVSAYFSFTVSHEKSPNPNKQKYFEERAKKILEQGIDEFCKSQTNDYIKRFAAIDSIVKNHPDIKVLFYEDMVLRNDYWQQEIFSFLGTINTSHPYFTNGIKHTFEIPAKENVKSHKRKVLPDDHLEKLKPETIDYCKSIIGTRANNNSLIFKYI